MGEEAYQKEVEVDCLSSLVADQVHEFFQMLFIEIVAEVFVVLEDGFDKLDLTEINVNKLKE